MISDNSACANAYWELSKLFNLVSAKDYYKQFSLTILTDTNKMKEEL